MAADLQLLVCKADVPAGQGGVQQAGALAAAWGSQGHCEVQPARGSQLDSQVRRGRTRRTDDHCAEHVMVKLGEGDVAGQTFQLCGITVLETLQCIGYDTKPPC